MSVGSTSGIGSDPVISRWYSKYFTSSARDLRVTSVSSVWSSTEDIFTFLAGGSAGEVEATPVPPNPPVPPANTGLWVEVDVAFVTKGSTSGRPMTCLATLQTNAIWIASVAFGSRVCWGLPSVGAVPTGIRKSWIAFCNTSAGIIARMRRSGGVPRAAPNRSQVVGCRPANLTTKEMEVSVESSVDDANKDMSPPMHSLLFRAERKILDPHTWGTEVILATHWSLAPSPAMPAAEPPNGEATSQNPTQGKPGPRWSRSWKIHYVARPQNQVHKALTQGLWCFPSNHSPVAWAKMAPHFHLLKHYSQLGAFPQKFSVCLSLCSYTPRCFTKTKTQMKDAKKCRDAKWEFQSEALSPKEAKLRGNTLEASSC